MGTTILLAIIALVLSLAGNQILYRFASPIGMLDIPNHRSSHVIPTPRTGGIAIAFSFLGALLIAMALHWTPAPRYLIPFGILVVMGIADDRFSLRASIKLVVILSVAILMVLLGNTLNLNTATWLVAPVTVMLIFGMICGSNFVDGLDGLGSALHLIIFAALAYVGFSHDNLALALPSVLIIAAISGFLVFNYHPARLFMGDTGSMLLGFMAMVGILEASKYLSFVCLLLILGVPLLDFTLTIVRRLYSHNSLMKADKNHLHHRLMRKYKCNNKSVLVLALVQLVLVISGLLIG